MAEGAKSEALAVTRRDTSIVATSVDRDDHARTTAPTRTQEEAGAESTRIN